MDFILYELKKYPQQGRSLQQLQSLCGNQTQQEFVELCKALNRLQEEHKIFQIASMNYVCIDQIHYMYGVLRVNSKGFGFVENDDVSVYISKHQMHLALDKDEVIIKVIQNEDESKEGEILQIVKRGITHVIGTIKQKEKICFLPDARVFQRPFHITNAKDFPIVNNTKVMVEIDRYDKVITAHIVKIIGYKYDPGVDILSILYECDIKTEFEEQTLKEVTKIDHVVQEKDKCNRKNFFDKQIITIDGDDAKDLDDAISVEKLEHNQYRLGVHIADVSYYVKENSALDHEAYERGTSVYVSDRVVPMLPQALSNGICSLNPKVERLTISCMMDIDEKGEVVSYEIVPSMIKTVERMTYQHVNEILAGDIKRRKQYQHILTLCEDMKVVASRIRKRRQQKGAIDFESKEAKVILNKKGKPVDIVLRNRGESEKMIEDFMICANECVASCLKWLDYPCMYRIHEIPERKKMLEFAQLSSLLGYPLKGDLQSVYPKQLQQLLQEAKDDEAYPILSNAMLKSMQKARYEAQCIGHFGLALEDYLHFTSPIRRYPDLIVHRMLRKYYFTKQINEVEFEKDKLAMPERAKQCSSQERKAIDAERAVSDMKKAEYMEQFIGSQFQGVISNITKFGMFVELENTVEGLVHISSLDDYYHYHQPSHTLVAEHSSNYYRMGQSVCVELIAANRFERQIDFKIVNKKKTKKYKKSSNIHAKRKQYRS